ncbi:MAG: hypothetical protein V3R24_03720 [Gemmatimonadales bacterium]
MKPTPALTAPACKLPRAKRQFSIIVITKEMWFDLSAGDVGPDPKPEPKSLSIPDRAAYDRLC